MARKVAPPTEVTTAPEAGADDLATLHPDVTLTLGGRTVTVREYGFMEGLRVRAWMAPFTTDLGKAFDAGSDVLVEDVLDLVGAHADLVQRAIAQSLALEGEAVSAGDIAWIDGLGDADGDLLINHWWGVCGLFFVRQVVRRKGELTRRKVLQKGMSAGPTSTTSSSPAVTATGIASTGTPNASSSSSTNAPAPAGTTTAPT